MGDLTHKTSGFVRYTNGAITPGDTDSVKAAKIQHHTLKAALTDDKKTPFTYAVNPFHQVYQPQVYGLHQQQQFVRPSVYGLHRQHQFCRSSCLWTSPSTTICCPSSLWNLPTTPTSLPRN